VTVQVHPPPGEYVGPPVRTIALAGEAPTSSATTASITVLATNARVCPARIPRHGRSVVIATPPFTPRWALAPGGFSPQTRSPR